jgi:hypothetical protein
MSTAGKLEIDLEVLTFHVGVGTSTIRTGSDRAWELINQTLVRVPFRDTSTILALHFFLWTTRISTVHSALQHTVLVDTEY